jgi:hypothetical protein
MKEKWTIFIDWNKLKVNQIYRNATLEAGLFAFFFYSDEFSGLGKNKKKSDFLKICKVND